ncbi:MAG: ABC transporter permease [Candidatus Solibacter sp.]|nr:ABC transporter permease [Candidatus Solibacter sp.]
MGTLWSDLRYGLRLLRHAPGFTAVAVGALALGIGANTAIFSTVDAVLLRPLPFADPDRVVMVWEDATASSFPRNTPAPGNFVDWKKRNHVFTDMAATRGASANLTADGPPEQVVGRATTANFFAVLGVQPAQGRTFTEDEDRTGATVAIISHALWQRRYAGNPDVLNRDILINGLKYTIIGVMPRDFAFRNREMDFWIPTHLAPSDLVNRGSHFLNVVARLKPGVSLVQARENMSAIARQLAMEYPDNNRDIGAVVIPMREDSVGNTRIELLALLGAAGCVLLIACANLAGLLLARGLGRRREMAVRSALGANCARLVTQMIAEGALIALAGGVLGVLLAPAGIKVLAALVPTALPATAAPAVDARVLGFALLLSALTGVGFSIMPAWQASRVSMNDALKQGGRGGIGGAAAGTRDALVVLEVAAALVLMVGAGLMLQTVARLRAIDIGFRPANLLTLRTTLPRVKYQDPEKRISFYRRVLQAVRALPGVEGVGYASMLPFRSIGNTQGFRVEGRDRAASDPGDALLRVSSGEYLQTLGVRLVEGRLLQTSDTDQSAPVIVINQTLARRYFPKESALGHRIATTSRQPVWRTIVGVVHDVHERGYELDMKPGVYIPFEQIKDTWALPEILVVRTTGDPASLTSAVRRAVSEADAEQPVAAVATMDEIVALDVADRRQQMTLLTAFAALALLLASLGLYGLLAYTVTQRSREIGLRMALGASAARVVSMVVLRGVGLSAAGLGLGLSAAWLLAGAMSKVLYGVRATDLGTYGAVALLLCGIAAAASWIPVRRAVRIDPIVVLRDE